MPERNLNSKIVRMLKPLHAVTVRNSAAVGMPDINFAGGWLELKDVKKVPFRAGTPLKVGLRPEQRLFLRKRYEMGEAALLLLRTRPYYLLIDGHVAADNVDKLPWGALVDVSRVWWRRPPTSEELVRAIEVAVGDAKDR